MKFLGSVFVLMCWPLGATAGDIVFYDGFDSGDATAWWAPARVGKTGQASCFDSTGTLISCAGTGQDGEIQAGVVWPVPGNGPRGTRSSVFRLNTTGHPRLTST
jgi:hypothetical protein